MTPDEWLALIALIQRTPCTYRENHADRAFLAQLTNILTIETPPQLAPNEQKWLLTIKRECKL